MRLAGGLLAIVTVAACTGGPAAPRHAASPNSSSATAPLSSRPPQPTRFPTPTPPPGRVTRADYTRCTKTVLSHVTGLPGQPPGDLVPGTSFYGNGKLFTTLSTNGLTVVPADMVNADGSIHWKYPWWRYVTGSLTISGQRLDESAGPLTSDVPAGYGDTGFQASGVTFPSEGCWQVTAKLDHTSLTFVTFVVIATHSGVISHPR
jgi:hypothetical protein